jgi:hypothetical protein
MFGYGKRPREDSTPPSPEGPRPADGTFEDKVLSWFTRLEKQTAELKQEQSKNFKEQSDNLAKAFEALTAKHEALAAKHEALAGEHIQLKTRLLALESRQEATETQAKSNNIILYNLAETSPAETETNVKILLGEVAASAIMETRRLGPVKPGTAKPRGVLVKFTSSSGKHAAYKRSRDLRSQGIFIDDDLTLKQQAERQRLRGEFTQLKASGLKPFWRGSKLMKITQGGAQQHFAPTAATASTSATAAAQ